MLSLDLQGVTVPIPPSLQSFIPSTIGPSRVTVLTSTSTATITSVKPPTRSEPNFAAIAGAVAAIVAGIFIAATAFVCWKRSWNRKWGHNNTRMQGARRRGILARLVNWRSGSLVRADTVSSWSAGREERDDSNSRLLSKDPQRVWASQQPGDLMSGYPARGAKARDARATTALPFELQLTPPEPPPPHLKPNTLAYIREDWTRNAPMSGNPFVTPPHSRSVSYDRSDRYFDGTSATSSLPSTAVSVSTPFSGGRPFLGSNGDTPPSSASSLGALQDKPRAWTASEGSVLQTPAGAVTAAQKTRHQRNLTIDTAIVSRPVSDTQKRTPEITVVAPGVPEDPKQVSGHDINPPPVLAHSTPSDEGAAAAASELQQMFTCGTPISDYEVHESICGRFETSSTEGYHELRSPAVPESATMEMYGNIGFGVMGGKWEPRNPDSNRSSNDASLVATPLSYKRSKRSMKTPPGPRRYQSAIKRGASVASTSVTPSPRAVTPPSPSPRSELQSGKSWSDRSSESRRTQVVSTGTISSLLEVYSRGPSPSTPQGQDTIFEVDENAPPVPGTPIPGSNAPTSPLNREGTFGSGGRTTVQELAQRRGQGQVTPLAPRTAPPRRSVAPEDFSGDSLGLSRENTRRW